MASKISEDLQDDSLKLADRIIRAFETADGDSNNDDGFVDEVEFTAVFTRAVNVANEQLITCVDTHACVAYTRGAWPPAIPTYALSARLERAPTCKPTVQHPTLNQHPPPVTCHPTTHRTQQAPSLHQSPLSRHPPPSAIHRYLYKMAGPCIEHSSFSGGGFSEGSTVHARNQLLADHGGKVDQAVDMFVKHSRSLFEATASILPSLLPGVGGAISEASTMCLCLGNAATIASLYGGDIVNDRLMRIRVVWAAIAGIDPPSILGFESASDDHEDDVGGDDFKDSIAAAVKSRHPRTYHPTPNTQSTPPPVACHPTTHRTQQTPSIHQSPLSRHPPPSATLRRSPVRGRYARLAVIS